MRFYGTEVTEQILVCDDEGFGLVHYIELTKPADEAVFYVGCCCDEEWGYAFRMLDNSSYEEVKYAIMEAVSVAEDTEDLMEILNELFEDEFEYMLIEEDEFECDGDCDHCNMK